MTKTKKKRRKRWKGEEEGGGGRGRRKGEGEKGFRRLPITVPPLFNPDAEHRGIFEVNSF
jgi:hypothetical protein